MAALNFPDPSTQTPLNTYSPTSTPAATTNGSTYIWNGNAWTGVVDLGNANITSSALPPSGEDASANDLWFNTDNGNLYIYYVDEDSEQWVDTSPDSISSLVIISETAPENPLQGQMWWDSREQDGVLYIYYEDPDSAQWVEIGGAGGGGGDGGGATVESGSTPPNNPKVNTLWFNDTTGKLYIYYDDGDSEQWVDTSVGGGGGGGAGDMPTGGGDDKVFYENEQRVSQDYTLTTDTNAMTAGPITVDVGASVTVPAGQTWTVVGGGTGAGGGGGGDSLWQLNGSVISPATVGNSIATTTVLAGGSLAIAGNGLFGAPGNAKITLNGGDGSAEFNDTVKAPSFISPNYNASKEDVNGVYLNGNTGKLTVQLIKDSPTANLFIQCLRGTEQTFSVSRNGDVSAGSYATTDASAGGVNLLHSGAVHVKRNGGTGAIAITNSDGGTDVQTARIDPDGDISTVGDITAASYNTGQLAGFRNQFINGGMDVWQRLPYNQNASTMGTESSGYAADRWHVGSNDQITRAAGPTDLPFDYALEFDVTSHGLRQGIELSLNGAGEAPNSGPFIVGSTWTLSCYATFDLTGITPLVEFRSELNGASGNGFTPATATYQAVGNAVNGYTRYTCTFTNVNATPVAGDESLCVVVIPDSDEALIPTNGKITGLQFEPGPVATPFEQVPLQTTKSLCERYYYRLNSFVDPTGGGYRSTVAGLSIDTNSVDETYVYLPDLYARMKNMRKIPSVFIFPIWQQPQKGSIPTATNEWTFWYNGQGNGYQSDGTAWTFDTGNFSIYGIYCMASGTTGRGPTGIFIGDGNDIEQGLVSLSAEF